MTGLFRCFDAAYPPATPPPGCSAVLGYIGGSRATNIWKPALWLPFQHLRQFPCWVPAMTDAPAEAGTFACRAARELGWAPNDTNVGPRVIVCDLETIEDPSWYRLWSGAVVGGGFTPVAYGSLSTIFANRAASVWVAAWDGKQDLPGGTTVHGHQYAADQPYGGTEVDYSVVDEWLYTRGGVGPRH